MKKRILFILLSLAGLSLPAARAQESLPAGGPSFRILVMPTVGIGTESTLSYGVRLGCQFGSVHTAYVQWKSHFASQKAAFSCDKTGEVQGLATKPWYTGEKDKSRWSVTAGYGYSLLPWLSVYAGAGYGKRALYWATAENRWAEVEPSTFSGLEMETGVMAFYKNFSVSVGAQTCMFKYSEITVGVGFLF